MAKITTIQHFRSVDAVKEHYGTTLPKPFDWRLLAMPLVGAIHAIPTSHGVAIATNGVLVAIAQEPNRLFIGHLESFVPDEQENEIVFKEKKERKPSKAKKPTMDISEFI